MPNELLKPIQVRVRITSEDDATIEKLANPPLLSKADITTLLLNAAVEAVRKNGNKMALPLRFQVTNGSARSAK